MGQSPAAPARAPRWSATVRFEAAATLAAGFDEAVAELLAWEHHGRWVPMTHVDVHHDDPVRFTAWTGRRPLVLEDRMEVAAVDLGDGTARCEVRKLGPVLVGTAVLHVGRHGDGCRVRWLEEVDVPWLPRAAAPLVGRLSAAAFRHSLHRMDRQLAARQRQAGR